MITKYESKYIDRDDIRVETDRYWRQNLKTGKDIRIEFVKLTQVSTGFEVGVYSKKGQIRAYNNALKKLEEMYIKFGDNVSFQDSINLKLET